MPRRKTRDEFSPAVVRALRDRVSGKCSQPACRRSTVGADLSSEQGITLTGNASHICAASSEGPRYDPGQTPLERASVRNGIWLCGACAQLIDKNGGRNFSVETIREWKVKAEKESANALMFASSLIRPAWLDRLITIHYANIPRLTMWDPNAFEGMKAPSDGFPDGFIGHMLLAVERAIANAQVRTVPLEDILPPSEEVIGSVISFHSRCFTKNGQRYGQKTPVRDVRHFDPDRSPYFYLKAGGTRVVFPYDPAWITTNTAHGDFNSGQQRFAGIGLVKRITSDLSEMVVSPLIVGLAYPPSMDAFYASWDGRR